MMEKLKLAFIKETYEYALLDKNGNLMPFQTKLKITSNSGQISTATVFFELTNGVDIKEYNTVKDLLYEQNTSR